MKPSESLPQADGRGDIRKDVESAVLECRGLAVGYKEKRVLEGVDLSLKKGQFVTLLGPNGAGKTTLLRTLSRHLDPLSGSISLNGRPLAELGSQELARFMAVVLTEKVAPALFSVYEFVALGRYPHTGFLGRLGKNDHAAVKQALESVRAGNLSRRVYTDLSDGERQKALVARALAQEPSLLLLDEPTMHLDLKHRLEVMAILRDLCRRRGITVLASLHDVDVAAKVSDQVALVRDGAVNAFGPPEKVLTGKSVADLYDFDGASFSSRLGGIEIRGDGAAGKVFVAAGMGTGAQVFRLLAKRGFSFTTGVIHDNDLDYFVARSLGAGCVSLPPMREVDNSSISAAMSRMNEIDVVIDCGFPVGPLNRGNLALLRRAFEEGKTVLSLRNGCVPETECEKAGFDAIFCEGPGHLMETLESRISVKPAPAGEPEPAKEAAR